MVLFLERQIHVFQGYLSYCFARVLHHVPLEHCRCLKHGMSDFEAFQCLIGAGAEASSGEG